MRIKAGLKLGLVVLGLGIFGLGTGITAQAKTKNVIDHRDSAATNRILKAQGFRLNVLIARKDGVTAVQLTQKQGGKRYESLVAEKTGSNAAVVQTTIYQGKKHLKSYSTDWWCHPAGRFHQDLVAEDKHAAKMTYVIAAKTGVRALEVMPPNAEVATSQKWRMTGQAAIAADLVMNRQSLRRQKKAAFRHGKGLLVLNTKMDGQIQTAKKYLKEYKGVAKQSPKLWRQYQNLRKKLLTAENSIG